MTKYAIMCTVSSAGQVISIINELRGAGFSCHDISILLPDGGGSRRAAAVGANVRVPQESADDADPAEVIEKALGWVIGVRSLSVPDVGLFIAVGPIVDVLSDLVLEITFGGLTGALSGMGLAEGDARQCEESLKNKNVFIAVHTDNLGERICIKSIFRHAEAQWIGAVHETISSRR